MIENNSIILKYNQYLESGLLQTKFMDYLSQKVNQQKQNDFRFYCKICSISFYS